MSRIDVESVWKIYPGDVIGVRDASFTCNDREFLAILGPSGGGKSSMLRMLAGLEAISRGYIRFDGQIVNDWTPAQRQVALAFESYALYQHLTVYENIAFPLRAAGVKDAEVARRVKEMAELLDLTPQLKMLPSELSSGQQQRVSLARAFIRTPRLTLLDEPISHMDHRVRMALRATIRHLHEELGLTTIYVTHDQAEATSLCDRLLIINKGQIQQVGTVDEIWHQPANRFVAYFVGEPAMNFIEAEVKDAGTLAVRIGDAWKTVNSAWEIGPSYMNTKVTLGFRPQEIQVIPHSDHDFESALPGVVRVIEPQGHKDILTVELRNQGKTEIKAVMRAGHGMRVGDEVGIRISPDKVYIFDGDTPIIQRTIEAKVG